MIDTPIELGEVFKLGAGGALLFLAYRIGGPLVRTFVEKATTANATESALVAGLYRERDRLIAELEKKQESLNQMTQNFFQMEAKLTLMQGSLDRANDRITELQRTIEEIKNHGK